jgi:ankyrin repeat protein
MAPSIFTADRRSNDEKRLFRAIDSGDLQEAHAAISAIQKTPLEARDRLSKALLFAVQRDALEASKLLVHHGADIEARDSALWRTPLIIAGHMGSEQIVDFLLGVGADVHAEDDFGNTVMFVVAESGSAKLIELLIAHGCDPEHRNDLGWTPIISASANGNLEAVSELAKQGASLEARAALGWTALIVAAQNDEADVVSLLLELGAKRDAIDTFGRTALSASDEGGATAEILRGQTTFLHGGDSAANA